MASCPNTLWNVRCLKGHRLANRQRLYEGLTSGGEMSPLDAFITIGLLTKKEKDLLRSGKPSPDSIYGKYLDLIKEKNTPEEAFEKLGFERDYPKFKVLTSPDKLSVAEALELMDVHCPACRLEMQAPPVIPELQTVTNEYTKWEDALPRGQAAAVRRVGTLSAVVPSMSKPSAKTGVAAMFSQVARIQSDAPRYTGPPKGERSMQDPSTAIRRYNEPYKGGEHRATTEEIKAAMKRGEYKVHQLPFFAAQFPDQEEALSIKGKKPMPVVMEPTIQSIGKLVLPKPSASIKASAKKPAVEVELPKEEEEEKPKAKKKSAAKKPAKVESDSEEEEKEDKPKKVKKSAAKKKADVEISEETEPIEPKKKKAAPKKKPIEP